MGSLRADAGANVGAEVVGGPAVFGVVIHYRRAWQTRVGYLKECEHDRHFYALCQHMEPDYHPLEFDLRLWLTAREMEGAGG